MNWQDLLNSHRLGKTEPEPAEPYRSPYQRDLDRITFSSSFRRLQDKTQVHPLSANDYIRTRLTHSLEVASVGRSLGIIIGTSVLQKDPIQGITPHDFGAIVSAACLAHDIGNPPFGHAGEDGIQDWFSRNKSLLTDLTEVQKQDFLHFEGNAQGLRIITRLQNQDNDGGLQLTYAMLGTFTKYPRASNLPENLTQNDVGAKKFGFFQSEQGHFRQIAQALGLIHHTSGADYWARHPLAFLLEAADDICYSIIDFEDGYKIGKLNFRETEGLLKTLVGPKHLEGYSNVLNEDKRISYLRSKAIAALIDDVTSVFFDHEHQILQGQMPDSLLSHIARHSILSEIMALTREQVYTYRAMTADNIAGFDVVAYLLNRLVEALLAYQGCGWNLGRLGAIHQALLSKMNLPEDFEDIDPYHVFQLATDYISGMTDSYAIDLYRQLEPTACPAGL